MVEGIEAHENPNKIPEGVPEEIVENKSNADPALDPTDLSDLEVNPESIFIELGNENASLRIQVAKLDALVAVQTREIIQLRALKSQRQEKRQR